WPPKRLAGRWVAALDEDRPLPPRLASLQQGHTQGPAQATFEGWAYSGNPNSPTVSGLAQDRPARPRSISASISSRENRRGERSSRWTVFIAAPPDRGKVASSWHDQARFNSRAKTRFRGKSRGLSGRRAAGPVDPGRRPAASALGWISRPVGPD